MNLHDYSLLAPDQEYSRNSRKNGAPLSGGHKPTFTTSWHFLFQQVWLHWFWSIFVFLLALGLLFFQHFAFSVMFVVPEGCFCELCLGLDLLFWKKVKLWLNSNCIFWVNCNGVHTGNLPVCILWAPISFLC